MTYILTNAIPILLAGLAATLVLAGLRRGRTGGPLLGATLATTTWLAAILAGALILAPVEAGRWTVTLGTAGIIWGGFILPSLVVTLRSRGIGWGAAFADAGGWLAAMLVQATVLQLLGLTKP
jgi:hypothetical protein